MRFNHILSVWGSHIKHRLSPFMVGSFVGAYTVNYVLSLRVLPQHTQASTSWSPFLSSCADLFLISQPPSAHPSPDSSLVLNNFPAFLSPRRSVIFPPPPHSVSAVNICQITTRLSLIVFLNRRFIKRHTVTTECAFVAQEEGGG